MGGNILWFINQHFSSGSKSMEISRQQVSLSHMLNVWNINKHVPQKSTTCTIWLFNIAMENHHAIYR